MSVNGIGNNFAGDPSTTIVKEGKGKDKLLRDDFMLMLIEQIKNQDPLNPMENTEFTTQLAQFSTLEGIGNMNTTLDTLLLMQSSLNNTAAVNLVGKEVEIEGNGFELIDNVGEMTFTVPKGVETVEISIKDDKGMPVTKVLETRPHEGINKFFWDGNNNSGVKQKNGQYTFTVKATGAGGEELDSTEITVGEVTNLIFEPNGTYLVVNNNKVSVGNILGVRKK